MQQGDLSLKISLTSYSTMLTSWTMSALTHFLNAIGSLALDFFRFDEDSLTKIRLAKIDVALNFWYSFMAALILQTQAIIKRLPESMIEEVL